MKWSLLGLLQYLETTIIYTNEDVDDIILVFKDQLKLLSGLQNLTKSALNKAIKLSDNLEAHRKRPEIKQFLIREFATKHNYKLKLDLWGALKGRMAVRSELEWTDKVGLSFKSYGVQVFQFNDDGLVKMNYLSFNDEPIAQVK